MLCSCEETVISHSLAIYTECPGRAAFQQVRIGHNDSRDGGKFMNKNASLVCRAKEVHCRRDHVVLWVRGVTTWPDNQT